MNVTRFLHEFFVISYAKIDLDLHWAPFPLSFATRHMTRGKVPTSKMAMALGMNMACYEVNGLEKER